MLQGKMEYRSVQIPPLCILVVVALGLCWQGQLGHRKESPQGLNWVRGFGGECFIGYLAGTGWFISLLADKVSLCVEFLSYAGRVHFSFTFHSLLSLE